MGIHEPEQKFEMADVAPTARGDRSEGFGAVQQFLVRHGYLPSGSYEQGRLDDITALALDRFQEYEGLRRTGVFDPQTRDQMTRPRCGMPSLRNGTDEGPDCAWKRNRLTYAFGGGTAQIPDDNEYKAVREAFATWQKVIPVTFTEVVESANPDILVRWVPADHPNCVTLVGAESAHSALPPGCRTGSGGSVLPRPLHFDNTEALWSIGYSLGHFDVQSMAVHEIGHLIGLTHARYIEGYMDVMWPVLNPGYIKRNLAPNDVSRARSLYWQPLDSNAATAQLAASGMWLYKRHNNGRIYEYRLDDPARGWVLLDSNPKAIEIVADGDELYQRHLTTGAIYRYTGIPMEGWQLLDSNPATAQLAASGGNLYKRHTTGRIYRYTGTPMTGWELLDSNARTIEIAAGGNELYQRHHTTGAIHRYTGTPGTGWQLLDSHPATTQIAAAAGILCQVRLGPAFGEVLHYTGGSWHSVATHADVLEIGAAPGKVYELRNTGEINKYSVSGGMETMSHALGSGTSLPVHLCAADPELYQLRHNGTTTRYYR
ncbi:matrixin family metalloprotease [Streptomyces sp. NPDC001568]|uniref:matrixin family metalloprotease n=1 Tax=Streptomyces sp. NPDC001568 TaxID=3364588 RepID=UPI00368F46CF